MRDSKFRGQRVSDKKWLYGYRCGYAEIQADDEGWEKNWSVVEETIGEYTGLLDKNNKEVFENDIIKVKSGLVGRVEFYNYQWLIKWAGGGEYPLGQECEVIGNIYENQDLLKRM